MSNVNYSIPLINMYGQMNVEGIFKEKFGSYPSHVCAMRKVSQLFKDILAGKLGEYTILWKKDSWDIKPLPKLIVRDETGYSEAEDDYEDDNGRSIGLCLKDRPVMINISQSITSGVSINVHYSYGENIEDIKKFVHSYSDFTLSKKSPVSLLIRSNDGYRTAEFDLKPSPLDIALNYGKSFVEPYEELIKELSMADGKGIALLHGLPGTGKTSLIRNIITKVGKEVIMIPSNMGEFIGTPDFLTLLINHPGCILVIEDAEKILTSRESSQNFGVANVLNLADGIVGDCIGIQIIATFNTKRDEIDEALLRKGRLIIEHEFLALSIEDSNALLDHLGKGVKATKPMTLAEIYNVDKKEFKSEDKTVSIGFKR